MSKEFLVELTSANVAREGGDWNTNLILPYNPPALSPEECQEIQAKFEFDLENEERKKQGLPPLEPNGDLAE